MAPNSCARMPDGICPTTSCVRARRDTASESLWHARCQAVSGQCSRRTEPREVPRAGLTAREERAEQHRLLGWCATEFRSDKADELRQCLADIEIGEEGNRHESPHAAIWVRGRVTQADTTAVSDVDHAVSSARAVWLTVAYVLRADVGAPVMLSPCVPPDIER